MDTEQLMYTQVMGENGEIKYVPVNPPKPPQQMGGDKAGGRNRNIDDDELEHIKQRIGKTTFSVNDKLTEVLVNLTENSKRLRYNKRLQTGKLDGKRLTAYKTSDRLFKQKAIKEKHYQFTFLIDTSGSMLGGMGDDEEGEHSTRIQMSLEAVFSTAASLEQMGIRNSIFGMNNSFRLFKGFDEDLDASKLLDDTLHAIIGTYDDDGGTVDNAGGTSEWVAYEQAVEYISQHSDPKITNVVIIISDGEPGGAGGTTQVIIDGEEKFVDHDGSKDRCSSLAQFWLKRPDILAFGLGIGRKAKQVPTNKQIDDIKKLPEVMGNLLTELMM